MKNTVFGDNITYLKKLAGLTQAKFSKKYGCTSRTVARWEAGWVPWEHTLRKISYFFSKRLNIPIELFDDGKAPLNKDFEFLLENNKELIALGPKRSTNDVDSESDLPIIEHVGEIPYYDVKVGFGPGKTFIKNRINIIQKIFPDIHPSVKFVIRAKDNRMEQAGIHKGDLLFVTPIKVSHLKEGDVVVVADKKGIFLVYFITRSDNKINLVPASSQYRSIIYDSAKIRIIGKVIQSCHLRDFH